MQDEGQQRVEIVSDASGERYGVTVDAYHELYESRGFRIDRFEDGRPYHDVDEKAEEAGQGEAVPVAVVTEAPAPPEETATPAAEHAPDAAA